MVEHNGAVILATSVEGEFPLRLTDPVICVEYQTTVTATPSGEWETHHSFVALDQPSARTIRSEILTNHVSS